MIRISMGELVDLDISTHMHATFRLSCTHLPFMSDVLRPLFSERQNLLLPSLPLRCVERSDSLHSPVCCRCALVMLSSPLHRWVWNICIYILWRGGLSCAAMGTFMLWLRLFVFIVAGMHVSATALLPSQPQLLVIRFLDFPRYPFLKGASKWAVWSCVGYDPALNACPLRISSPVSA